MSITCTRRIQFCAGHRVVGHEGKCRHPHGHNYVAWLRAEFCPEAEGELDDIGRVIDFSILKQWIGGWIENHWDHGFIISHDDGPMRLALSALRNAGEVAKTFVLPRNPTAENMAWFLLEEVGPQLLAGTQVRLTSVIIEETENCKAEATLDGAKGGAS